MTTSALYRKYGITPAKRWENFGRILKLLLILHAPLVFINSSMRSGLKLGLRDRFRAFRYGFLPKSHILYDLGRQEPSDFMNDSLPFVRYKQINGVYRSTISNKLVFAMALNSMGIDTPRVYGYVQRGLVDFINGSFPATDFSAASGSDDEWSWPVIFKPVHGWGGNGIFVVDRNEGIHTINGHESSHGDLSDIITTLDDYFITEFVRQAEYASQIYPDTANTVRVLTLRDPESGKPFIAAAAHRFGSGRVRGVADSFHGGLGGISCRIDLESGVMGRGATISRESGLSWMSCHPDTGVEFEGVRIPQWGEISDKLLKCMQQLPFMCCAGWDIVVRDDGWTCLECNSGAANFVWQVHGGLLKDPRIRRFFEHHGVIRRR